jgi:hypothetical protein
MLEKRQDHRRIQLFDGERGRSHGNAMGSEGHEELEGGRVGLAGVAACPAFAG